MPTSAATTKYVPVWELESLGPHPEMPEFRQQIESLRDELSRLADDSDRLPEIGGATGTASHWAEFLRRYESVDARSSSLRSFVGCYAAAEAENRQFQRLEAELAALEPLKARVATNVEFALRDASEAGLEAFLSADAYLRKIAFFLQASRRDAMLRLPKEQELLAADLGVDGIHAWGRLYDRISGELRVQVMERGEVVEKSPGQVQFDSPQRAVRENNFYAADKAWSAIGQTCADALNHIAGTRLTIYRKLGLSDHLEAPLRRNRMRRETLEAMWSAVSEKKSFLLRYLESKARLLGLPKLAWYDVHAPLPQSGGQAGELAYDDACDQVIETFAGFSPELGDFARMAVEQGWIEAENRAGKRQGGFCTGFAVEKVSRIFMTFTDTPDSMSTLAHELGHAYHTHVLRGEPLFLTDYPMNLAETASTFAEAVLFEQRLSRAGSRAEELTLLDSLLGDSVAYLMNIHSRFLFENALYQDRRSGELSTEQLCERMLEAQRKAFLNALAEDGWNANFWISKLHFYITGLPFYNFPYTFGYLLSLGLYALARESGPEFPEQYKRLLIATGNRETEEAVESTIGYDLTRPEFWNKSLDIVEQRVRRFEELAGGGG